MRYRLTAWVMGLAVIAIVAVGAVTSLPASAESSVSGHDAHAAHSGHADHSGAADARQHGHNGRHTAHPVSGPEAYKSSGKAPCGKPWDKGKHCPPCYLSLGAISAGSWTRPQAVAKIVKALPQPVAVPSSAADRRLEGTNRYPLYRSPPPHGDLIIVTGRLRI